MPPHLWGGALSLREGNTIIDPVLTGQIALRASHMRPDRLWPGCG